jgi:hypothetical protein
MLSRNGVSLARREPIRVTVHPSSPSLASSSSHDGHDNNMIDDDDYHDHGGNNRGSAALIWLWQQTWTKRMILMILLIIIFIGIIQLIKSPSMNTNGIGMYSDADDLGGPPSWRRQQQQEQLNNVKPKPHTPPTSPSPTPLKHVPRSPTYRPRPRRNKTIPVVVVDQPQPEPIPIRHHDDPSLPSPLPSSSHIADGLRDNTELDIHDTKLSMSLPSSGRPSPLNNNTHAIIEIHDPDDDNNNNIDREVPMRALQLLPSGTKCVNTVQGVHYVTDSTGAVCPRRALTINGCCDRERTIDLVIIHSHLIIRIIDLMCLMCV